MSCFAGRMKELKNVSIDCFENSNLSSTAYFLSHCHTGMYHANLLHLNFFITLRAVVGLRAVKLIFVSA
jgi:hypothetical protein